jgi:hypothetical protein
VLSPADRGVKVSKGSKPCDVTSALLSVSWKKKFTEIPELKLEGNELKRSRSVMIALFFLFGANMPGAVAQTDGSGMVSVVTTFFTEANAHNIGCGGLGDPGQIDKGAASALFVDRPSVTDVVPPWHWEGTTAFKDWMADVATYCTRHEDTDFKFTLGKPLHQEVDGDRGNVIVPLVLDFKEGGKPLRAKGLANVVLLKNRETWKISAFTFTQQ